jgi:very-short-patch-repair endonuclease
MKKKNRKNIQVDDVTRFIKVKKMSTEMHKGAPARNFLFSKENRKQATEAEKLLWKQLRDRNLYGLKFRRQHPVSDFIADFYCDKCKLIIEIDGAYHDGIEQKQHDDGRTFELTELKITIIRFTNAEVIEDMNFVLGEIKTRIMKILSSESGKECFAQ